MENDIDKKLKEEYWDSFAQTGKISEYLKYRTLQCQSINRPVK